VITLITGLPGHGKSLWTVSFVEDLRKVSGRPVYYKRKVRPDDYGLSGIKFDWVAFDRGEDWVTCPAGAIIVIDECQHLFPPRRQGAEVPGFVEKMSTHRHAGHDIFLISQDAMQFDAFVRRLVGRHIHVKRSFGLEKARVLEWQGVGNPSDYHSKKEALKSWWSFPVEVFGSYDSAEVHTVKRSMPWKPFIVMGGLVVAFVVLLATGFWVMGPEHKTLSQDPEVVSGSAGSMFPGSMGRRGSGGGGVRVVSWDAETWAPRVSGVPESAPAYDGAVAVNEPPRVAGCMSLRVGRVITCRCATQQGTEVPVDLQACRAFVRGGSFDYRADGPTYYPQIEAYVAALPSASSPPSQASESPSGAPEAGAGGQGGQ